MWIRLCISFFLSFIFVCGVFSQIPYVINSQTKITLEDLEGKSIKDFSIQKGKIVFSNGDPLLDGRIPIILGGYEGWIAKTVATKIATLQVNRPRNFDFSQIYYRYWHPVSINTTGMATTEEVDPSRMRKNGDVISFWAQSTISGKTVVMRKQEVNCATNQIRITQGTVYMKEEDGELVELRVAYTNNTPNSNFAEPIPDTVGDILVRLVCSL